MKLFNRKQYPKSTYISREGVLLSFCITHQNRFEYLKKTLKKNLGDNLSLREKIEFILVDFSLDPNIRNWVYENFRDQIETGYLKFFQTDQMPKWSASIAKNTAHQLGIGSILTNLDCDNFTGEDGARFVIDQFQEANTDIILWQYSGQKYDGSFGRISISSSTFRELGGYDESLLEMGWQDNDIMRRGTRSGLKLIAKKDRQFNQAIKHEKYKPQNMSFDQMNKLNEKQAIGNIRKGLLVANEGRLSLPNNILQLDSTGKMRAINTKSVNRELIIIGMGTYKRPKMLKQALESFQNLKVSDQYEIKLLIVGNEVNSNIEKIIDNVKVNFSFEVYYAVELKRGIVHVRNRIVDIALNWSAKYLGFLDDDETVSPNWIEELYSCLKKFNATAVEGKVIYQLPEESPEWLFERDYFSKGEQKTGKILKYACTNNVLIDLEFVRSHDLKFSLLLNDSGGSDTHFFDQMRRKGGKIIRCEEAITYEKIPESRATREWIIQRAYKSGVTAHVRNCIRAGRIRGQFVSVLYVMSFFLRWLLKLLKFSFLHQAGRILLRREIAMAEGTIHAMIGRRFQAYAIIHGD